MMEYRRGKLLIIIFRVEIRQLREHLAMTWDENYLAEGTHAGEHRRACYIFVQWALYGEGT